MIQIFFLSHFTVFEDQCVNYSILTCQISFTSLSSEYNGVKILFQIGNPEFVLYQIVFRILFSVTIICFLVLMLMRLKTTKFNYWHLEQKLTLGLLSIVALYDNPLYGLKIFTWSKNYFIDAFFRGLTIFFSIFFIYALLDSLRFKNRETSGWFFFQKFLVAGFLGILFIIEGYVKVSLNIGDFRSVQSLKFLIQHLQSIILPTLQIASLYLIFIIILAFKEVDPTEKYKLNLYVLTFVVCLLSGLVCYQYQDNNSLIFTVQYVIINLFAILMSYYHWPYEVKKDFIYDEQNQDVNDSQDEPIYEVKEDSDN